MPFDGNESLPETIVPKTVALYAATGAIGAGLVYTSPLMLIKGCSRVSFALNKTATALGVRVALQVSTIPGTSVLVDNFNVAGATLVVYETYALVGLTAQLVIENLDGANPHPSITFQMYASGAS